MPLTNANLTRVSGLPDAGLRLPDPRSQWAPRVGALLVVCLFSGGCAGLKVLAGAYDLLDSDRILAITPGASVAEVEESLGSPEQRRDGEFVYLYVGIRADEGETLAQEAHIYFDDAGVVDSTTYVVITNGSDDVLLPDRIFEVVSAFEIGRTTLDEASDALVVGSSNLFYENGGLVHQVLHYRTDRETYDALAELPFVLVNEHDDGVTYTLMFDPRGLLIPIPT